MCGCHQQNYNMHEADQLLELFALLNPNNIDCHGHTQKLIVQEEIEAKLQLIKCHFNSTYPQTNIVLEDQGKGKYLFSLPLEIFCGIARTNIFIKLDFACQTFVMHIEFSELYGRMQVKQKMIRLQLARYMLRLNNNMRVGSFYINPKYGYFGLNMAFLTEQSFRQNLLIEQSYQQQLFPYLDSLIYTGLHTLRFHFMRILFMTNTIKIKDFPLYEVYMEKEKKINQWRKIPKESFELLLRIKKIVKNDMHVPFTVEQYQTVGPILAKSMTSDQKCLIEIELLEAQPLVGFENKINEGGFCNIYSKELFYSKNGDKQNKFKRNLVIKQAKSSSDSKIINEFKILKQLSTQNTEIKNEGDKYIQKTGCCPYIAQFYYLKEKKDSLLMERYFHSSLDYYKEKQKEVMSLTTIIYIAYSVAMGLRYCHSYGIIHMDIKPANILISKALTVKICDFGEAISQETQNVQSGRTYPYAAPELAQKKKITSAYDIFGFGTMLFELIFNRYPIDYNQNRIKNFEERFLKNSYCVRYDEEYAQTIGPQVIVKYLGRMCIQCLQPDPEKRPKIDKICLVLKDCLSYLDKVY